MPQAILPLIPDGATLITDKLSVVKKDGRWIYFHGCDPVFSHGEDEIETFRMFTAQLICHGACRNRDIVKVFGVSSRSVIRSIKKYRQGGHHAFYAKRKGRGGTIITEEVKEKAHVLFLQGMTRQEVADELDIPNDTLRKAINDGRVIEPKNFVKPVASDKSTRSKEDAAMEMGTACTRPGERVLSALGLLQSAPICFEPCRDVTFGGVLCSFPALACNGLFSHIEECFKDIKGYYTTIHILVLLAYMALCRIKTVEQLRYQPPGEFGKLLGLDRIPEVRCLRNKLKVLVQDDAPEKWAALLSQDWMEQYPGLAGTLYIDGHVRVYHGSLTKLPRRYVSRQRLCLRGITDYWVNDIHGQPFFFVERQVDSGLLEALRTDIVPRLLKDIPNQPIDQQLKANPYFHRFVLVFDREGYSPAFFKQMWEKYRIACISYHKFPGDSWPQEWFKTREVSMPNGELVTMKLAEMGSWIGDAKKGLWVREVRKLTDSGHQTSLISTAYKLSLQQDAIRIFSRWCQENFFGYMMQHFGIDILSEYGSEGFPVTSSVVNPAWSRLEQRRRSLQGKLNTKERDFGRLTLEQESDSRKVEQWQKRKSELYEEIQGVEHDISNTKTQLKQTPKRIQWGELPEQERFNRLLPSRHRLFDTIRMITYRAETAMTMIVREVMSRQDDARSLIRDMFLSEADILPDTDNKTLNVCLHYTAESRHNRAIEHLVQHLNDVAYKYPGTELILRFSLGVPELPAPVG
ncbi:MAG: hypothetical protein P9X24_04725 [Candidatus Hatepunaea meridiana]|nr:hypothetical protein [Candidatus Hatepunaea meridiana]